MNSRILGGHSVHNSQVDNWRQYGPHTCILSLAGSTAVVPHICGTDAGSSDSGRGDARGDKRGEESLLLAPGRAAITRSLCVDGSLPCVNGALP